MGEADATFKDDVHVLTIGMNTAEETLPSFYAFQYAEAWDYSATSMMSFRGGSDHGTKN